MNAFNFEQLRDDNTGMLESCDFCNCLIHHWDKMTRSFVIDNGHVVCRGCFEREMLIMELTGSN